MIRTEVYSKKKYRRIQTENQEKKREKVALGQSTEDVWTPTPTFSTRDKRLKALFTNLSIDSLKYDLLISSFSLCNYTIIFVLHKLFACCRQWMSTFFSPTEEWVINRLSPVPCQLDSSFEYIISYLAQLYKRPTKFVCSLLKCFRIVY